MSMKKILIVILTLILSFNLCVWAYDILGPHYTPTEELNMIWEMDLPVESNSMYNMYSYSLNGDGIYYSVIEFEVPVYDSLWMWETQECFINEINCKLEVLQEQKKAMIDKKHLPDFSRGYIYKKMLEDSSRIIIFTESKDSKVAYVIELIV